ncbi:orotidine-5'-phosphate decarboxylase [Candidatus Gracilibacteria bacterium]|nr:orotidine-5'-phosphate decarboxylase [Candidatus Gracilibacteria bacterium]MCF7819138.1 orotidine-5'-phosphate decarboxylase [Candidatus Gracilibacteria bacterium]
MMNFSEKLESVVKEKNSCLMLGLDPKPEKFPKKFTRNAGGAFQFCSEMIESLHDLVCGVKIQMAYFEVFGHEGIAAVEKLIALAKEKNLIVLIDGKRNDIGSTAEAYAKAYLGDGPLSGDALTVNPLLGTDGMLPFIKYCEENGRGIFVLVRTSNPSAAEFQGGEGDLSVRIAEKVEEWNMTTQSPKNNFSSVGAVLGATIPEGMLSFFREEMPHAWFLCPGVGAQGGSMEEVLKCRKHGIGVLIPVSRSVLYASDGEDYIAAAREEMQKLWEAQG